MSKPETRLRANIKKALQEKYPEGLFFHVHGSPYQEKGVPDLCCVIDGLFIGMEIKDPESSDGKPNPGQISFGRRVGQANAFWEVIYTPQRALEFADDCLKIHVRKITP